MSENIRKLKKQIIESNSNLSEIELLNWSMNQLFRAARTMELQGNNFNELVSGGCDATATVILKKLIKTKKGYELVRKTNPKLLRGYKKP